MLRKTFAAMALTAVLFGGACSDNDDPSPTSENNSDPAPSTSQVVPPGNPESGETGTDGSNTGGG